MTERDICFRCGNPIDGETHFVAYSGGEPVRASGAILGPDAEQVPFHTECAPRTHCYRCGGDGVIAPDELGRGEQALTCSDCGGAGTVPLT
jgi:hypothetical protein